MKNEQEFKKRISEIAAKIAEADNMSFDKQIEELLPTLSILFNKVRNEDQLADIISAMVKHMPAGKNKSVVTAGLKIAGKVANTDPAVSKDDPNAMYDKMEVPDDLKEKYEGEKYNLPDTILARINSSVANQQDLALAILDLIKEILTNEPTMKGIEDKGNWKTIMSLLKTIGGVAKDADNDGPPEVSAADVQQAKKTNSNISEIYNRIKRN
jgi:hypothetical protein